SGGRRRWHRALSGALRFARPWSAYPSTEEGSANHFSEACPASGWTPRAKLPYSSRLQQANLNSQNLLTIAMAAGRRQYARAAKPGFSGSVPDRSIPPGPVCKKLKAAAFWPWTVAAGAYAT